MKKLLILFVCIAMVLCLVACGNKGADTNTNTDTATDTSTNTNTDTSTDVEVTYTVTVKDQDNNLIVGAIIVTLDEDDEIAESYTTDENGVATVTIVNGQNNKLNVLELPDYMLYENGVITLGEETDIAISVRNTEPIGTADRPFPIEDENEITIPALSKVYYILYGGSERNFVLSGANGIILTFAGEVKDLVDGAIEFKIPEMDSSSRAAGVAFENTTDADVTFTLNITSDPGSYDNPFELEIGSVYEHVLEKEKTLYYMWTATKTGYFVVHSESAANSITLYNQTTYAVTNATFGASCDYIWVNEGDELMIYVSSTNAGNYNEVIFDTNCYAGTESDPIPLYIGNNGTYRTFLLKKAQELTFTTVQSDENAVYNIGIECLDIKVFVNSEEITPDEYGYFDLGIIANGGTFTIVNTDADNNQDVYFYAQLIEQVE